MGMPAMDKFCFVMSLRSGCITMGIANAILALIGSVLLITFATNLNDEAELQPEDKEYVSGVIYTIIILIVVLVVDIIFVYAVYKEKIGIMKKYWIYRMVFLVLFIIGCVKALFYMNAGYVIVQLLFLAENVYYIVMIRSYMISINEDGVLK